MSRGVSEQIGEKPWARAGVPCARLIGGPTWRNEVTLVISGWVIGVTHKESDEVLCVEWFASDDACLRIRRVG